MIFHLDDGTIVDGQLTIPRRGMRMSDYLAGSEREFINVGSATLTFADDRSEYSPFVMIARKSIRMIKPGPRDEAESDGDLSAWEPSPTGVHATIPRGTAPPQEPKPPRQDPPVERPGSGIYPPKVPAVHLNRPSSGSHEVPEELKDEKKKR